MQLRCSLGQQIIDSQERAAFGIGLILGPVRCKNQINRLARRQQQLVFLIPVRPARIVELHGSIQIFLSHFIDLVLNGRQILRSVAKHVELQLDLLRGVDSRFSCRCGVALCFHGSLALALCPRAVFVPVAVTVVAAASRKKRKGQRSRCKRYQSFSACCLFHMNPPKSFVSIAPRVHSYKIDLGSLR
ncbi:hypothetical protein D3C73_796210 [compost metagenome]